MPLTWKKLAGMMGYILIPRAFIQAFGQCTLRIETSAQLMNTGHQSDLIHGLIVKCDKSDWLNIINEFSHMLKNWLSPEFSIIPWVRPKGLWALGMRRA